MNRQLRRPTSRNRSNSLQRRRLTLESLERRIETALAEFTALKLTEFKSRKERPATAA